MKTQMEYNSRGVLCAWVGEKCEKGSRLFKRNMFSRVAQGVTIDLFECVEMLPGHVERYDNKVKEGEFFFVNKGTFLIHEYDEDKAFLKAIEEFLEKENEE